MKNLLNKQLLNQLLKWLLGCGKKTRTNTVLLYKYVFGLKRMRDFYLNLIVDFEIEHNIIIHLIEYENINIKIDGDTIKKYHKCKSKISAILRAKNRIHNNKTFRSHKATFTFYLHNYFTEQRYLQYQIK